MLVGVVSATYRSTDPISETEQDSWVKPSGCLASASSCPVIARHSRFLTAGHQSLVLEDDSLTRDTRGDCGEMAHNQRDKRRIDVSPTRAIAGQHPDHGSDRSRQDTRGAEEHGSLSLPPRRVPRPPRRVDGALAQRSRWRACPAPIWPGQGPRYRDAWKHRRPLLLSRAPCP
jgi:hypothetical protein